MPMPGENILNLQEIDNPDDRRELRACLEKLDQAQRDDFARWLLAFCNQKAELLGRPRVEIRTSTGIRPFEMLRLVMVLIVYHGLTTKEALCEAERRARSAILIGDAGRFRTIPEGVVRQNHQR
jgi:hypothetical protein